MAGSTSASVTDAEEPTAKKARTSAGDSKEQPGSGLPVARACALGAAGGGSGGGGGAAGGEAFGGSGIPARGVAGGAAGGLALPEAGGALGGGGGGGGSDAAGHSGALRAQLCFALYGKFWDVTTHGKEEKHHTYAKWVARKLCPMLTSDEAKRTMWELRNYNVPDTYMDFGLNEFKDRILSIVADPEALHGAYIGAYNAPDSKGCIQFHDGASPISMIELVRALSERKYGFSIISCGNTINRTMAKQIEDACMTAKHNLFMWKTKDGDFDVLTRCDSKLISAILGGQSLYDIAKSFTCPPGCDGMWTFGPAFRK